MLCQDLAVGNPVVWPWSVRSSPVLLISFVIADTYTYPIDPSRASSIRALHLHTIPPHNGRRRVPLICYQHEHQYRLKQLANSSIQTAMVGNKS